MKVDYKSRATLQLSALPDEARIRIIDKMRFFAEQPNPLSFAMHLTNLKEYRFRVGDYRVICDIEKDVITVLLIGKRDSIYQDL